VIDNAVSYALQRAGISDLNVVCRQRPSILNFKCLKKIKMCPSHDNLEPDVEDQILCATKDECI